MELFIITGTSGTGKTTIVPLLRKKLSDKYLVYDWDEILRPYDQTKTWPEEATKKMFQLTTENIRNNKATVVVGLVRPSWLKKYQQEYRVRHIKFCLLDVSTEERVRRLRQRQTSPELIRDLEEHKGLRTWIEESGYENITIDTTNLTSEEIVSKLQNWIK